MRTIYNIESETIETVYTYEEWLKEYKHQETKQRMERLYYIKQRLAGTIMVTIGIIAPFILDGDITVSLVVLPLGIFLTITRKKIMTF